MPAINCQASIPENSLGQRIFKDGSPGLITENPISRELSRMDARRSRGHIMITEHPWGMTCSGINPRKTCSPVIFGDRSLKIPAEQDFRGSIPEIPKGMGFSGIDPRKSPTPRIFRDRSPKFPAPRNVWGSIPQSLIAQCIFRGSIPESPVDGQGFSGIDPRKSCYRQGFSGIDP